MLVVAAVAAVVTVAARAGLSARREAIEIVHGLGATDGYIAGQFARRATLAATLGGFAGALAALPVLLGLANLAAPFANPPRAILPGSALAALPAALWLALPGLPAAAAAIGFLTAQGTVGAGCGGSREAPRATMDRPPDVRGPSSSQDSAARGRGRAWSLGFAWFISQPTRPARRRARRMGSWR